MVAPLFLCCYLFFSFSFQCLQILVPYTQISAAQSSGRGWEKVEEWWEGDGDCWDRKAVDFFGIGFRIGLVLVSCNQKSPFLSDITITCSVWLPETFFGEDFFGHWICTNGYIQLIYQIPMKLIRGGSQSTKHGLKTWMLPFLYWINWQVYHPKKKKKLVSVDHFLPNFWQVWLLYIYLCYDIYDHLEFWLTIPNNIYK